MSSGDHKQGCKLLRKWCDHGTPITVSLRYGDPEKQRVFRARISGYHDKNGLLTLRRDDGEDIELALSQVRFDSSVASEELAAMGLDPSKYPESLAITTESFSCDLFTEPES